MLVPLSCKRLTSCDMSRAFRLPPDLAQDLMATRAIFEAPPRVPPQGLQGSFAPHDAPPFTSTIPPAC